jgi:hypothetical protein
VVDITYPHTSIKIEYNFNKVHRYITNGRLKMQKKQLPKGPCKDPDIFATLTCPQSYRPFYFNAVINKNTKTKEEKFYKIVLKSKTLKENIHKIKRVTSVIFI